MEITNIFYCVIESDLFTHTENIISIHTNSNDAYEECNLYNSDEDNKDKIYSVTQKTGKVYFN